MKVPNLRGVGDVLAVDPHKKMLKKSKRLAKKMGQKGGGKKNFDYGGKMFSAEAWAAD